MSPIAEQHVIVANDKAIELYSKFNINITNILDLKNGKEFVYIDIELIKLVKIKYILILYRTYTKPDTGILLLAIVPLCF
jgi:hypothetical protein